MLETLKIGEYSLEFVDFLILFLLGYIALRWLRHALFGSADELHATVVAAAKNQSDPPVDVLDLTPAELSEFDGLRGRQSYVAFNGKIYNVSHSSALFRSHEFKHLLGTDATAQLISTLTQDTEGSEYDSALEYWQSFMSRKYTKIGNLID